MGNRVSTSTVPFSLEDLEAIARGPLPGDATSGTSACTRNTSPASSSPSAFDAVVADLAAAVTTPSSGAPAPRKTGTSHTTDSGFGGSNVHYRKENLKVAIEQQFADIETSLHVLRCVPDFARGRRLPLLGDAATAATGKRSATPARETRAAGRRGSRHSDPFGGGASDAGLEGAEGNSGSGRAAKKRASCTRAGTVPSTRSGVKPFPSPSRETAAESPRSWIFRDVSVQAMDLTQTVDVGPSEVYVVIVVQRNAAANGPSSVSASPLTSHNPAFTVSPSLQSLSGATSSTMNAGGVGANGGGGGGRGGAAGRTTATVAAGGSGHHANSHSISSPMNLSSPGEWPREMVQAFTPRGLSTPFSSDISRLSASGTFMLGSSSTYWVSPSATPRTNGSTSNRPTPRSGGTAVPTATFSSAASPASPRSTSSLPTPRTSGFHYSIHLLTGRQADALTAAAGFLAARSIEKMFLECPDFDRRLFYHVNAPKVEETIRAYNLYVPTPDRPGSSSGGATNTRASSKTSTMTEGIGGALQNVGGATTSSKGIQRGLASSGPTGGGGPLASGAQSTVGISQSSSSSHLVSSASGTSKGSSLYYITATQEAARELLRELLAAMRPVPVVVPRFACQGGSPASAQTGALSSATPRSHNADVTAVVSSNSAELLSVNALFRVLSGVRVGTPRWSHTGDAVSPLNSARFALPSGSAPTTASSAAAALTLPVGMSSWYHELLPSFRPPRRGPSAPVADTHRASSKTHAGERKLPASTSSWLQGPQPLDVHSATPAAGAAVSPATSTLPSPPPLSSPTSTTPRGGGRLPPARSWSAGPEVKPKTMAGHPFSPSALAPPQLPSLALGSLLPKSRRPAPLNAPPNVTQTATPSLVTTPQQLTTQPRFSLPLEALLPKTTSPAAAAAAGVERRTRATEAAQPTVVRSAHGALAEASGASENAQGTPVKQARPRSRHPSGMKGEGKGGTPLKKRRSHDETAGDAKGFAAAADLNYGISGDLEEDFNEVHTQQERAQRLKAAQPEVTEVLPYLFVGGETAARDRAQLLAKGVTHIVNTVSWCLDSFYPDAFHYLTLSLSDAADEPIFALFPVVNAFVEKARRTNDNAGRVFIHCQQGVSRSCTFIIAYVMWRYGMCYDRAYEMVRARRNVCSPNTGFMMNLKLWEAHLTTPQLNTVYAFAPYTAESPTPFVYQLATYYSCTTESTADTERTLPESRDHYYQLCADVLRRAVDQRGNTAVDTISLDPRLCYVLLCAPRHTTSRSSDASRLASVVKVRDGAEAAEDQVEACLLLGASCTQEVYAAHASAACSDLVRYGFYHGELHTSTDNTGRVLRFAPLREVHMIPSTAEADAALPLSVIPATLTQAQALLARHVAGRCSIAFAAQPRWNALLALPDLPAKLARYLAESHHAEAAEATRRDVRAAEVAKKHRESDPGELGGPAGSGARPGGPRPPTTSSPASASAQLFRASRHTPRAPRQPQPVVGSSGAEQRTAEAESTVSAAAPPPSALSGKANVMPHTKSPGLANSRAEGAASGPSGFALSLPRPPAAEPHEGVEPVQLDVGRGGDRRANLPLFFSSSQHAAGDAAEKDSASGDPAPSQLLPRTSAALTAEAPPPSLAVPSKTFSGIQVDVNASHMVAADGDNFAYAYPFTAASREVVADLDDLESDRCYAIGFQQGHDISLYLWRGVESALEVHEVVSAFFAEMVTAPREASEVAALRQSMENMEWITCSLQLPLSDTERADGASSAAVLPKVRVLFVEQSDEPEEFVTLL